jgi:hypothetical protein
MSFDRALVNAERSAAICLFNRPRKTWVNTSDRGCKFVEASCTTLVTAIGARPSRTRARAPPPAALPGCEFGQKSSAPWRMAVMLRSECRHAR